MLLPRFAAAQKHAQMENAFWARAPAAAKKKNSETGNRTPGICVTGRDVTNYTISDYKAFNEDRTRDLALTKRMLCQLSYEGEPAAANHAILTVMRGVSCPVWATAPDPA